jgi:putative multiple sugar transport system ATP-binding protein
MSGGNQQKVVLAKWILADTEVLIFDEPTRGIDVQAKREIYVHMDHMSSSGKAILLISSELSELIGMCDRIYVMREGAVAGELKGEEITEEKIGQMMFGSEEGSEQQERPGRQV